MRAHIEGLIAAPFTPMDAEGQVDLGRIEGLAELLVRNGVVGAFVCGTTGESLSLTEQERREVTERWIACAPPGFRVIVHVGHDALPVSRALAAHAEATGAYAIGTMPPTFFRLTTVGQAVEHLTRVAEAAPGLPCYYYHIPSLTGCGASVAALLEEAHWVVPNLAGAKFTHEDLADFADARAACDGQYDLLYGRDEMLLSALALGARGAVGSTYNFAAPLYQRLIAAFDAGEWDVARALQQQSIALVNLLSAQEVPFLSAAKALMRLVGVDCGETRWPLRAFARTRLAQFERDVLALGFEDYASR
jgi:N-acetylneuraminate lyase